MTRRGGESPAIRRHRVRRAEALRERIRARRRRVRRIDHDAVVRCVLGTCSRRRVPTAAERGRAMGAYLCMMEELRLHRELVRVVRV